MYKVLTNFYLNKKSDENHYLAGDTFPRPDVVVNRRTIQRLLTADNRLGRPVIIEIKEDPDYNKMTVKEIKDLLDERGIEYRSDMRKADLIELLG